MALAGMLLRRFFSDWRRSHYIKELDESKVNSMVTLCGFAAAMRSVSSNLAFMVLRDNTGSIQAVASGKSRELLASISLESAISVRGILKKRPASMINKDMASGLHEIEVLHLEILNHAESLPFMGKMSSVSEDVRLKYRYLDLRRPEMMRNLQLRSKVYSICREYFEKKGMLLAYERIS